MADVLDDSLFAKPTPAAPPAQPQLRSFVDAPATRTRIYSSVMQAAQSLGEMKNQRHTLRLKDPHYADPEVLPLSAQKQAILTGKTLGRRLRGTWELVDNTTGDVLESKLATVASVPFLTNRGTVIHNGNEYIMANQQRLLPGAYARVKHNGEVESHCLHATTRIWTEQGLIPIGKIVSKRMALRVWSYDFNSRQFVLRPITGWYRNKVRTTVGRATFRADACAPTRIGWNQSAVLWATPEHKVYDLAGQTQPLATTPAVTVTVERLSESQKQVVLGSLLGDGHIDDVGTYQEAHAASQAAYLELKAKVLGELAPRGVREWRHCRRPYQQRGKTYPGGCRIDVRLSTRRFVEFQELRKLAYDDNRRRRVSVAWLEQIDARGLAFWFCDDGSARRVKNGRGVTSTAMINLATHGFSSKCIATLVTWLAARWGVHAKAARNAREYAATKDYGWYLLIHGDDAERFLDIIAPFISETMRYKLPAKPQLPVHAGTIRANNSRLLDRQRRWEARDRVVGSGLAAMLVDNQTRLELRQVSCNYQTGQGLHFEKVRTVYDIQVDGTHNYFANGVLVSNCNPAVGTGMAHRYFLDPAKGVFYMRVQQAKIPLMPVLKALGATEKQLYDAWGDKLLGANYQADSPIAVKKLHQHLVRETDPDYQDTQGSVVRALQQMKLDPDVMRRTLGKPYQNLSLDAILDITKKLVAVSRGEAETDDRDSLAFQKVMGIEDLLAERLTRDSGRLRRQLLFKASLAGSLKPVLPGALTKQIEAALLSSGLGSATEEVNLAEVLDKQSRITRLGEGGIPSDAVPDEARSVTPSQMGVIDLIRTPESSRAGIDLYIGSHTRKGDDGRIYIPVIDAKTGETVQRSPQELADLTVAFPGEMSRDAKRVATLENGRLRWRTRDEVDVALPHFEGAFSPLANLVPLKSAAKGQRMSMAARMLTQAMPLEEPEAPLVQNAMPDNPDRSFEEDYGRHMGAVFAETGGRVMKVTPDAIVVRTEDGGTKEYELYNQFPNNRKSSSHNTASVAPGDFVKPGQLLARSNFTDERGTTALGKNLYTAYMPYMGKNYEDAIVISQSAAKKLSSVHMYQHGLEFDDKLRTGKSNYVSIFPAKYERRTLQTLDTEGVVRPGQIVNYGDPLILAAQEREVSHSKVHKKGAPSFTDTTVTWDHHTPGKIVDVIKGPRGVNLSVTTVMPMEVGDKLSNRYGGKGVVSEIVPDAQMPHDTDGTPFEILMSDLGVVSRSNPSQNIETALGLIAKKTGRPYKVQDFPEGEDNDWIENYAEQELRKHGLKSTDAVVLPTLNRKVPNIQRGYQFFMKLHHTAADKGQARGTAAYTMTDEPAKGGETGSKRVSLLNLTAILGSGASGVLEDVGAVRGQRNDDYWMAFMRGHTPPKPKIPLVYEKFVNELQAAGIRVVPDGPKMHIMALTDKDIDTLAGDRELTSGDTVRWDKGLEPVKGGLFDPTTTGGHGGKKWTRITLTEPMVNPVLEEPVRRVLGLTQPTFLAVLAGKAELPSGGTGPAAIQKALEAINVDKELESARAAIASGKKTARDVAIRKLGYLKSAKRLGIHPSEWMLTKAPVLPPAFRPLAVMSGNNLPLVSDANYLYKELLSANDNLKALKGVSDDVGNERLALYGAFKAVTGLGDPVHPKLVEKGIGGILKSVLGSSPKQSVLQRKLIGSTTDVVGRAVITPDPELDIDSVGLPEDRAWNLYQNFIVRRLSRRGMPLAEALRHAKDRTPLAKEQMLTEMQERPVFIDRAPVLHKFGIMAFWPKLTAGSTLRINPTLVGGFGADFDGDAMQYHVPVSERAKEEAIDRMLPSRNLISPADFKTPMPMLRQEYLGGLHTATARKSKRGRTLFRKLSDAVAAYRAGEINVNDEVELAD